MRERMRASARAAVMTLIAVLLLPASAHAQAPEEVEARSSNLAAVVGLATFDVVILRPLGLIVLAVGATASVPVTLVTAPNGWDGIKTALNIFVIGPWKHVFRRPLGDF